MDIKNEELCIKNEELCIKNEELRIKCEGFCRFESIASLAADSSANNVRSENPLW